jgi:hypothetical protein
LKNENAKFADRGGWKRRMPRLFSVKLTLASAFIVSALLTGCLSPIAGMSGDQYIASIE